MSNKEEAIKEIGHAIQPDNSLYSLGHYIAWPNWENKIVLDSDFTLNELKAMVWWMENMKVIKEPKND